MNEEQQQLWNEIKNFELDEPLFNLKKNQLKI